MKKKWWIIGALIIILVGGVNLYTFNQNEKHRKEQQMIKMETITAKQIKNTFADVTEIEFSEKYYENKLSGYTSVDVTITTGYGVTSGIGVSLSINNKSNMLRSYAGGSEFKEGTTENKVKVIFSNKTVKDL